MPLSELAKVLDPRWLGQERADRLKERATEAYLKGDMVTMVWTMKDGIFLFELKIDTPFAQFAEELVKMLDSLPDSNKTGSERWTVNIPLEGLGP